MKIASLLFAAFCLAGPALSALAQGLPSPRGPFARTWEEAYARMTPFRGERRPGADPSTLKGKVVCGYQGWFLVPGDGSGSGWTHFGQGVFRPGNATIDLWPDMSEATPGECYPTDFKLADGSPATVFSSYNATTVNRHFKWMADYGIDGAFLQRFGSELKTPDNYDHVNAILDNVRHAANANGRTWSVMYDLSGLQRGELESVVAEDWKRLADRMEITKDPSYQHHNGKPVVTIWGVGFDENRPYTLDECAKLIDFLKHDPKYGGNCVMLGLPYGWRDQVRDAVKDAKLHDVIRMADIVSPWATTRYNSVEMFNHDLSVYQQPDLAWCNANKLDYMPVIFPGFRWKNLETSRGRPNHANEIDRMKGKFFETQGDALVASGVKMLYIAMFDEIDEGTAIFKCTNNAPEGFGTFGGMPSDTYLKLAGKFSQELKTRK
jgi:hypothetical protein